MDCHRGTRAKSEIGLGYYIYLPMKYFLVILLAKFCIDSKPAIRDPTDSDMGPLNIMIKYAQAAEKNPVVSSLK